MKQLHFSSLFIRGGLRWGAYVSRETLLAIYKTYFVWFNVSLNKPLFYKTFWEIGQNKSYIHDP